MITTPKGRIEYLSPCFSGSTHDLTMVKNAFSMEETWFENHSIQADLGYLGFDKSYVLGGIELPHKKPKGKELSAKQKSENQEYSRKRVVVEHSIGGMKRYRVLSNRLRMHDL